MAQEIIREHMKREGDSMSTTNGTYSYQCRYCKLSNTTQYCNGDCSKCLRSEIIYSNRDQTHTGSTIHIYRGGL